MPPVDGDPSALNADGFARLQAGDYAGAVTPLEEAVATCGDSTELDPCGYALYNLGSALHRSGRSAEAIPLLEQRLARFDFKRGEVRAELTAARKASASGDAGDDSGSADGAGADAG